MTPRPVTYPLGTVAHLADDPSRRLVCVGNGWWAWEATPTAHRGALHYRSLPPLTVVHVPERKS